MINDPHSTRRVPTWPIILAVVTIGYVLSSGPVLAICFMLREATGWDGFYAAIWLYYPILVWGHTWPLSNYIEWWVVDVFNTVGPG